MITKNISLLLISNIIAVLIYFFRMCYKYGCVSEKHLVLPLEGIYMPGVVMLKDFKQGIKMVFSFKNAWIYMIIATSISFLFIFVEKKKRNEKKN